MHMTFLSRGVQKSTVVRHDNIFRLSRKIRAVFVLLLQLFVAFYKIGERRIF